MSTVAYPHIAIRSDGHPITASSSYKVRILVEEYLEGATPAELQEAHPRLTLSEIHAALSYYYDHQTEMDAEIAKGRRLVERKKAEQGESLLDKKWRTMSEAELQPLVHRLGAQKPDSLVLRKLKELRREVP
jgi:uncharacterized protein (DUF433 family)